MEEILGKRMRNRCLSLLIVFTLILCTPATDNGLLQGIFPQMFPQKAQAATGEIDDSHPLNAELIKDANLLTYLKGQTGKGNNATVKDLRSLTDIVVPGTVADLTGLGYATGMKTLDLSACTASRIEASEFSDCSYLESVKLPNTVKTIDEKAFNNCKKLTTINLESVDILNDQAFIGCAALNDTSVASMKNTLQELGDGVFSGCAAMTTAKVPVIKGKNAGTVPAQLFNGCESLSKVVFCDSKLTNISDQAFYNTGNLKFGEGESVKLPGTIIAIGSFAFAQSRIEELDLSETKITWISDGTFSECKIKKVTFPNTLNDIRTQAFRSSYLESVTIPNTVTKLGKEAFQYAGNLVDVKLSAELTEIPDYAFQGAGTYKFDGTGLGNIELDQDQDFSEIVITGMQVSFTDKTPADSKLKTIGVSAFNASTVDNDTFLAGLTKLTTIKEFAFSYTDFEKITIPACVETIEKQAFDGMYWLEEVAFASGSKVTELPEMLFGSDQPPAQIGTIGYKTYADLVLKRVQLPSGLKSIGKDCFGNCYSLKTVGYSSTSMVDGEVRFPTTLETIGEKAFEKCGLYEINNYDEDNKGYTNRYCGIPLYTDGFRKVTVPDSVTTLGEGAFRGCPMMEELSLGNGITEIPKDLCNGCGSYPYKELEKTKMTEKDALKTPAPGEGASSGEAVYEPIEFIGLQKVKLPENLETIGENAFSECYALKGFTNGSSVNGNMPGQLTDISKNAFYKCKSLESVIFPSSLETIGASAFAETSQDISEKVVSVSTGKDVLFFHQYSKDVGLRTIDFRYATKLTSIGEKAFLRSAVAELTFPQSAESLPASVCEDCYNLRTVTVPGTVTDIENNAFKNTYNLTSITVPLSANWSKTIFDGVAAYASKTLTVNANPITKAANVYVGKDNILDFTCIKNFNDVTLTVTDSDKAADDPNNNLLTHDSNDYISVAQSSEGSVQQISVRGKKNGSTAIQVSGNINLAGDRMATNNTSKLNDSGLLLAITQRYDITVTQNPVSVLEFSVDRLAEEAQKAVLYLEYGSTKAVDMKAVYKAQDATQATTDSVEWSVEDSSIVQLDGGPVPDPSFTTMPDGTVEGRSGVQLLPKNLGDTVVSVKSGEKKADCAVRVRLPLTNIVLPKSNITSDVNEVIDLAVDNTRYSQDHLALLEQNPNYGDVLEFTSDNEDVATVEKVDNTTGRIKTVAAGTAKIKITSLVTGRNATCTVTVTAGYLPPAESVKLSQDKLEMYVGDAPKGIQASVLPEQASQAVTWTSNNTAVATVVDGIITAVAPGNVVISAETENGRKANCSVTVKQHVESLTLEPTELSLEVGKSSSIKTTVLPTNASNKTITWSSSDESIATVNASGSVKGIKAGTATITATADGKTATCAVKVNAVPTAVKLSQEAADLEVGKQLTLTASVEPAEASQTIEWKSNGESIATVDNGVVTALKEGTCNITATAAGSNRSAVCKITVKAAGTSGPGGGVITGPNGEISVAKVKLTSAKNVKKKSIKVKWKAVEGATGYQVACGSKKKTTTKTTVTFKKLKKKKKYAVKVRAYVVAEGKKVYGKWSKAKKVKVKK